MLVTQIYSIINSMTEELLGKTGIIHEDLSNIVDVGNELFGSVDSFDNFSKSMVDHVGKVTCVSRLYSGRGKKSVMRDSWEFGSVAEKLRMDMPVATENESWKLVDGQSYDPNVFTQPVITAKFFNKKVTFDIERSLVEEQVKSAFSNVSQVNSLFTMISTVIKNAMTIRLDSLVMRTVNGMIGDTIYDEYGATALAESSKMRAVNLLYLYNQTVTTDITVADCMHNAEFLKFASYQMALYSDRLKTISTLFNGGGKECFTPSEYQEIILLSEFAKAADVYLQSSTFHEEFTALPNAETVSFWQGSGTDYAFTSTSKIDVKTPAGHTVATSGILGVMYDREALGVTNLNERVTTYTNPKAEFTNYWYKMDAGYFNDSNENFVVFFVA